MSMELDYELFLRRAFGYPQGMLDRFEDPAGYANTDFFSEKNLNRIKAGVAYAMGIFGRAIVNFYFNLSDQESDRIDDFTDRAMSSTSLKEIHDLIKEFQATVEFKYIKGEDGTPKFINPNRDAVL